MRTGRPVIRILHWCVCLFNNSLSLNSLQMLSKVISQRAKANGSVKIDGKPSVPRAVLWEEPIKVAKLNQFRTGQLDLELGHPKELL